MSEALRIGFGRRDITPRVGVELQGYGAYLNRHSTGVRDRLFARAVAFAQGDGRAVIVSCDLCGIPADIANRVRSEVQAGAGLAADRVLVHATHTHSGPAVRCYSGWGTPDPPYLEILPLRIARAALDAIEDLGEACLAHAEVPCEGMGINREYDTFGANLADALREDWRPAKPELTDTTCHVFTVTRGDRLAGFFSCFGCHPVIGGPGNRKIHGDYAGVATNLVERLHPGATGLFLQGAQGDVNAAATACDEEDTMRALDVLGARYARCVLRGLREAAPIEVDGVRAAQHFVRFSRKPTDRAALAGLLAEQEALLHAPEADDADHEVRLAMVRIVALRGLLERFDRGDDLAPPIELHGVRIGPVALLGSPFEVQRAIKEDVRARARSPIPLVIGFSNDSLGYAVDRTVAARGGYAADLVPYICGQLPFANIHDELAQGLVELEGALVASA